MAIFIEKPTSPGFNYPEAFPGSALYVHYPLSGEATPGRALNFREVMSQLTRRNVPSARTNGAQSSNHRCPPLSPALSTIPGGISGRRKNLIHWLSAHWSGTLTGADRALWSDFLTTANASPNPPANWFNGAELSTGFQLFMQFNIANELVVLPIGGTPGYPGQLQFADINTSLDPPYTDPPGTWNPNNLTALTAVIFTNSASSTASFSRTNPTSLFLTIFIGRCFQSASGFAPLPVFRTFFAGFLPGESNLGSDYLNATFQVFPVGQKLVVAARTVDVATGSPSLVAHFLATVNP